MAITEYQLVLKTLNDAIIIDPVNWVLHSRLGDVYLSTKRIGEAHRAYIEAYRLHNSLKTLENIFEVLTFRFWTPIFFICVIFGGLAIKNGNPVFFLPTILVLGVYIASAIRNKRWVILIGLIILMCGFIFLGYNQLR